jgi:predicted cobalt transporter CbtA
MVAYIDEHLEPLLRARRYAKVALAVAVAVGLWLLALSTHWIIITLATLGLLITLGFCHIALSPKQHDKSAGRPR